MQRGAGLPAAHPARGTSQTSQTSPASHNWGLHAPLFHRRQHDKMQGGSGRRETPSTLLPKMHPPPAPPACPPQPPGTRRSQSLPAQPRVARQPGHSRLLPAPGTPSRGLRPRPDPGLCHSVGTRKAPLKCVTRSPQDTPRTPPGEQSGAGSVQPPGGAEEPPPRTPRARCSPPAPVQPHAPLTCPGVGVSVARCPPSTPRTLVGARCPRSPPPAGCCARGDSTAALRAPPRRRHESRDWSQQHPPDGTELG